MDDPNRPDMTDPTRTDAVILPSLETPTLTKAELAELLFDRIGLNKRESKDIVDAFFDLLHQALVGNNEVKLSGFGNFTIREKGSVRTTRRRPKRRPKRVGTARSS